MTPPPVMVLSATYTDKGGNNIKALTGSASISLSGNTLLFKGNEKLKGFNPYKAGGNYVLVFPTHEGWFAVDNIDLSGIGSINLAAGSRPGPKTGFEVEARLDAPDGKILGKGSFAAPQKGQPSGRVKIPLEKVTDGKFHSIYFIYKSQDIFIGAISSIQFNP